jgi:hypothetical protein
MTMTKKYNARNALETIKDVLTRHETSAYSNMLCTAIDDAIASYEAVESLSEVECLGDTKIPTLDEIESLPDDVSILN